MRHQSNDHPRDRRREQHTEFRDRRQSTQRARLPPRDRLRALFDSCLDVHGGESLAFDVHRGDIVRAKVDRRNGPVDTAFLIAVLRSFRDALREAGFDPEDLDIEVDSPGENRELRTLEHWSRFQGKPVRVELKTGGPQIKGSLDGVDDGAPLVKTADGARVRLDPTNIKTMRLGP